MHSTSPTVLRDLLLKSVRLDGYTERCLFLGPFSNRANFAQQQNRALNLVCALWESGRLGKLESQSIAVVGGGVAGVTIAGALSLLHKDVHLFEKNDELIERQEYARHRWIHPTLNAWPEQMRVQEVAESLPFGNWCSTRCTHVVADLRADWKEFFHADFKARGALHTEVDIDTINDDLDDGVELGAVKAIPPNRFGLVIFAVGFEDEAVKFETEPYWAPDQFEYLLKDRSKTFVISGTGDGGLIDVLRLVYEQFADGRMVVKAALTCGDEATALVLEAERILTNAREKITTEYMSRGAPGASKAMREELPADVVAAVKTKYNDAAAALSREVLDVLTVKNRVRPVVYLAGKGANPFLAASAPIHKLLVARAIKDGHARYHEGEVKRVKTEPRIMQGRRVKKTLRPSTIIVRHGAGDALARLLRAAGDEAISKLHDAQIHISDAMANKHWAALEDELEMRVASRRKRTKVDWLWERASRFASLFKGIGIVGIKGDAFELRAPSQPDARLVPPNIFGVPLSITLMSQVNTDAIGFGD